MRICRLKHRGRTCHTLNRDEALFCSSCGGSLDAALCAHNPGTIIGRWYRVLNLIGYGGFGAVYQAEVVGHKAPHIALKETINPEHLGDFRKEFAVLRGLRHVNLPRYLDLFEEAGRGYLIMEYIPGQSLYDVIQRQRGPVFERLVTGYGIQICDVLEHLHSQERPILHRDIKPHNIRLTPEALIKLVDFGLAKLGADITEQVLRAGSLAYAPLEQWLGGTDERSDIYSLGATFYHLLTGRTPDPPARRQGATSDPLLHPRQINPKMSPFLANVVLTAMHMDRAQRFQSAAELRAALVEATHHTFATRPFSAPTGSDRGGTTPLRTPIVQMPPTREAWQTPTETPSGDSSPPARRHPPHTLTPLRQLIGHGAPVRAIAWGRRTPALATADSVGRMVLWAGEEQFHQQRSFICGATDVFGIAWSPDDQFLASAGRDKQIRLWRPGAGTQHGWWTAHTGAIYTLAWSPDGEAIASAGWDQTVRVWSAISQTLKVVGLGHQHHVTSLAWSPDSTTLASSSLDGTLRLWDNQGTGQGVIRSEQGAIFGVAWSPAGDRFATAGADGSIRLWRLDGSMLEQLECSQSGVCSVQWSPDGGYLVCGCEDGSLHLWRLADTNHVAIGQAHGTRIAALAWRADSKVLATAGDDRVVRLWRLAPSTPA